MAENSWRKIDETVHFFVERSAKTKGTNMFAPEKRVTTTKSRDPRGKKKNLSFLFFSVGWHCI